MQCLILSQSWHVFCRTKGQYFVELTLSLDNHHFLGIEV